MNINIKTINYIFFIFIITLFSCHRKNKSSVIPIDNIWKFKFGLDTSFTSGSQNWKNLSINHFWEDQENIDYDGFAWYETSVYIPSTLKHNTTGNDSLLIYLGPVDDCETTFLNGKAIGQNNQALPYNSALPDTSLYMKSLGVMNDIDRFYMLSLQDKRIKWDTLNKISVLALDKGGMGGFNMKDQQYIRKISPNDKINVNLRKFYMANDSFKIDTIMIVENNTNRNFIGKLEISALDQKGSSSFFKFTKKLNILASAMDSTPISLPITLDPVVLKIAIESSQSRKIYYKEHHLPFVLAR